MLERIDDDKHCVRVCRQEALDLLLQSTLQLLRHGSEEQIWRSVVRDIQQTVLDAAVAVLQAEVEHIALGSGKVPGRLTLRHLKTEPQRQPRFPYLWRSR